MGQSNSKSSIPVNVGTESAMVVDVPFDIVTQLIKELELSQEYGQDARIVENRKNSTVIDYSFDFPFLTEKPTVNYIKGSKVMFIMRGLPGSGKTTIVNKMVDMYGEDSVVCSADAFFSKQGRYNFQPERLKEAHQFSQSAARQACSDGKPVVIIDNTSVQAWEMEKYIECASVYNYVVATVEPKTDWKFNPQILAEKNSHNVSIDVLKRRVKEWDKGIPLYYGWFLNETDSQMLLLIGHTWLEHCFKIRNFKSEFKKFGAANNIYDPLKLYFTRCAFVDGGGLVHCTAKFTGKGKVAGWREFSSNPKVLFSYGKYTQLCIIGYVITDNTFAARVKLNEMQLNLWGQDDQEVSQGNNKDTRGKKKIISSQNSVESPCRGTLVCVPQNTGNELQPVTGTGSRAHITLGCVSGIKPVQAGFDVMEVVRLEENAKDVQIQPKSYHIPGAILKSYRNDLWVLYPDKQIIVSAFFTGKY